MKLTLCIMESDWATNKLDSAWESRHLGAFVACLQENFCKQFQEFIPTDRIAHMREVVGPPLIPTKNFSLLFFLNVTKAPGQPSFRSRLLEPI